MTCSKCEEPIYARGWCVNHYATERRKLIAYGRWDSGQVDPTEVLQHLARLHSWGMGDRRIGELSGICRPHLRLIDRVGYVTRHTHDAILAVPVPKTVFDPLLANGTQISVVGTQRRVKALARIGWSAQMLADRLPDCDRRRLATYTSGQQHKVTVRRARQVATLFEELSVINGPGKKARRFAELKGWPPPLAWDEDTIDDPTARPQHDVRRFVPFAERYVEVRHHLGIAEVEAIAEKLGQQPESVKQQVQRRRDDIARLEGIAS